MKKKIGLLFLVLMALMSMSGCGNKESKSKEEANSAKEAKSDEETQSEEPEEIIVNWKTRDGEKKLELNMDGVPKEYAKIVETAARYVVGEYGDEDKEVKDAGFSPRMGHVLFDHIDRFGYALMDIDGDGSDELLLGREKDVYNIYTIKDNKAKLVAAAGGMQDWYEIAEDGTICSKEFYNDKAIGVDAYYDFDGKKLKFKEGVSTHSINGSIINYKITEDDFLDDSNEVSNEEFLNIYDKYPTVTIELRSFFKMDLD